MAVARRIATFELVELTEPAEEVPAGAKGGVLEILADEVAMLEILEPELDAAARIVFVPVGNLRPTTRS